MLICSRGVRSTYFPREFWSLVLKWRIFGQNMVAVLFLGSCTPAALPSGSATGRNKAIIVELKELFVLNDTLSPFLAGPIIILITIEIRPSLTSHCRIKSVTCFKWHFYHLFWGFPSLDFLQLEKMMPAFAFNFIIVATHAWRGKLNR